MNAHENETRSPAASTDTTVLATRFFTVKSPAHPHVPACDGGHLFIEVNDPDIEDRTQLSADAAIECMWLTMVVGQAFTEIMEKGGHALYRINYQDNGNWSFLRGERPRMHIHIYGRTRGERSQVYGQALHFPDPADERYRLFLPLDEATLRQIGARACELALEPKYQWYEPETLEVGEI